jgi:hypothetical protein
VSPEPVVHCAEDVARKTSILFGAMAIDGAIDLLQGFSAACRDEFEEMRARPF